MEIPGYTLHRRLGSGGYSKVYAVSPTLAVKVLNAEHHGDAWTVQCFRREGIIGRELKHPSLVAIRDSHLHEPPYYHVCDRVNGHSLRDAALLPQAMVLSILEQIADALAAVHRAGFIHGDVKPANILLASDGRATLIDLGFARRPGSLPFGEGLPGTANYVAPELCRRDFVDTPAVDVFALGVTAFELLTGELPYPVRERNIDVLRLHRDRAAASLRELEPKLPQWIVDVVDGMLVQDLHARWKMSRVCMMLKSVLPKKRAA